jgi:hypothetical protein
MAARAERWLVRIAGLATFAAGVVVAARASPPEPLPAWTLSSRFVYGLAVAAAVIVPFCLLLALAVQTVVRGSVPTAISREGLTWAEGVASNGGAAIVDLQRDVERLAADLDVLATRVVATARSSP